MECMDCKGTGENLGQLPVLTERSLITDELKLLSICRRCKGAGEIPDEMMQWIEWGNSLRHLRLSKDITLRKMCETTKLGVDVISNLEQGYIIPNELVWNMIDRTEVQKRI
jgi:hypothetical protein